MERLVKAPNTILLAATIGLLLPAAAMPQNAATRDAFARGPYTGLVDVAIVGVTTQFLDRHSQVLEERHGTGVVLRSDGFVLFSSSMLEHRSDEPDDIHPTISIHLQPGTAQERRATASWPKSIPPNLPIRVIKLEDTHSPGIRTLLPACLKTGDPLTVAWNRWSEPDHRFGPIEQRTVQYAGPATSAREAWLETINDPLEGVPSGAIVIGPEGMAVGMVTPRTGADLRRFVSMEALGKVTNCVVPVPTPDSEFAATRKVEAVDTPVMDASTDSNDPAAAAREPKTVTDVQSDAGVAAARSSMVKVPGGPVVLPKAIRDSELEMGKATVACVPPFEIDRYEVTNKEYWEFWSRLPSKTGAEQAFRRQAWPAGWSASPVPFSADLDRLPVLGVTFVGAQAYARSVGKRLPTPYEWALVALGAQGDAKPPDWLGQYIADKNDVALTIKKAHFAFLQQYPDIHGEDFLLVSTRLHSLTVTKAKIGRSLVTVNADQRIHGSDFMIGLPWIISPLLGFAPELQAGNGFFDALNGVEGLDLPLRLKMQTWSRQLVDAETQGLWDRWKAEPYILPVGSRSFDISPCGASDMLWNGAELVVPPATSQGGITGFAVSVTMLHPQEPRVLDEMLLTSGPNSNGLVESYPSAVPFPLSRLIERTPGFPVAQWLWFQNNVEETRAAMRMISGWQVNMLPAASTVEVPSDNHSPFVGPVFYDNYPLYREWVRPSKHARKEIGSAITLPAEEPIPTPIVPRETGAALRFLVPIGFRCAR